VERVLNLNRVDQAHEIVNQVRAQLGSADHLITAVTNVNDAAVEELTKAQSDIRDVDAATVIADLVKRQVMLQSAIAVEGQARLSESAGIQRLLDNV